MKIYSFGVLYMTQYNDVRGIIKFQKNKFLRIKAVVPF